MKIQSIMNTIGALGVLILAMLVLLTEVQVVREGSIATNILGISLLLAIACNILLAYVGEAGIGMTMIAVLILVLFGAIEYWGALEWAAALGGIGCIAAWFIYRLALRT